MSYLHRNIKEDRQKELVINRHRYEPALVELRGRLPHHDAQPDAPHKEDYFHWKESITLVHIYETIGLGTIE